MPLTIPSIDMIEIGAGGGSIARVDDLGLLKVGPRQRRLERRARPATAAAASQPTVTDADLVLGLLDADNFLGGDMKLDSKAARGGGRPARRCARSAAGAGGARASTASSPSRWRPRRAPTPPTAASISAACRCSPSAGPGRCMPARSAALLQSSAVILPPQASVLSAFGTLVTPVRLDLVRSALGRLDDLDWARVDRLLGELDRRGDRGAGRSRLRRGQRDADLRRRPALCRPAERGDRRASTTIRAAIATPRASSACSSRPTYAHTASIRRTCRSSW